MKIETLNVPESCNNYTFNGGDIIKNISKVNIFIGSNNSGKSRMLRGICSQKEIKYNAKTRVIGDFNKDLDAIQNSVTDLLYRYSITTLNEINKDSFHECHINCITENHDIKSALEHKLLKLSKSDVTMTDKKYNKDNEEEVLLGFNEVYNKNKEILTCSKYDEIFNSTRFRRVYIPVLRSLRKISTQSNEDLLNKCTDKDYFKILESKNDSIEIFTGQTLYDDVLDLLCGDYQDRENLSEFEKFLGQNFFDEQTVSLIPKRNSDVLYVKIGDQREYPIYDLGDGIQSIIIMTFKLFEYRGEDVLFFIEEPELYMHPGLQRKLIETFSDEQFDTYQYFITSHSNHILDLTLDMNDISVFKFTKEVEDGEEQEKEAKFNIDNVNNDDMSVLSVLGVNNSSVFLSNCTIWVEGITDRFYLRKYLEIYQKDKDKVYMEDVHYSFLEYSGGNITHWDFLDDTEGDEAAIKHEKICNRMFLIADSDGYRVDEKNDADKAKRIRALQDYFKERFYCLDAKEIENILTPEVIKETVAKFSYKKDVQKYKKENGKKVKDRLVKVEEDHDAEAFKKATFEIKDYEDKNLGEFIEKTIEDNLEEEQERAKDFKDGNTIKRKVDFCKYAIKEIKSIDDMSEEAKNLCEKIYNFIKDNNQ